MTDSKIRQIVTKYINRLVAEGYQSLRADPITTMAPDLHHILWMCYELLVFVQEGRREKAMRWLGFIQGVLACKNMYTIQALKNDNKPI